MQGRNQGEQALGRSRGGLSTKTHTLIDVLGNLKQFVLPGGQVHDLKRADVFIPRLQSDKLLADKSYDAEERVLIPLKKSGKIAIIPPGRRKQKRWHDKHIYQARHLIENLFVKLKQYKAIATRYDKLAQNFLSGIYLGRVIDYMP